MERLVEIVNRVCKKYLPTIKNVGITFDLDFPDTTLTVKDKERIEKDLDRGMKSAVSRTKKGTIKLSIKKGEISITDTGTVIDKTTCREISNDHFIVKSRVGFGTTITIK
ncbi:HAMP domain-containing histidine kinase [Candidatus Saccharibacteria bacterium]|nr:HAMP domain-containing histidine kinase [Candidatus Saccharibacteria bacterium]MBR3332593.1 HAMP domain-containing histidine kinase [Candidatus Saccharibacteria bacterium]